ncbi:MAG TPA: putative porin, partial [Chthoniobacteraceae bacterium]
MSTSLPAARRTLALLLASTWCAAALPAHAGAPINPDDLPASNPAGDLPVTGLFAAADIAPMEAVAAQETTTTSAPPAPSANVTMNLINRLVERGVLTKEDASDLIKQAEADALVARAHADQTQAAAERAAAAAQVAMAHAAQGAEDAVPMGEDDMRVTYIPENVRAQMRDELREEVMAQARSENWA